VFDSGSSANAPSEDYDSVKRPQGTGFDIGALEYIQQTGQAIPTRGVDAPVVEVCP